MRLRSPAIFSVALMASCLNAGMAIRPVAALGRTSAGGALPARPSALRAQDEPGRPEAQPDTVPTPSRSEVYRANREKTVVDLQQFREATRVASDGLVARLIDLNPRIGSWYLLRVDTPDAGSGSYHLESSAATRLRLDSAHPTGIVIEPRDGEGARWLCELWPAGKPTALLDARAAHVAYAPLCGGKLYLRNPIEGHRTRKEQVVDLLRDHVWQGEKLTVLVKDVFYRDAYLAASNLTVASGPPPAETPDGPTPPRVNPAALDRLLVPENLELALPGSEAGRLAVGRWYAARENAGIFVTALRPDLVAQEVVEEQRGRVSALDAVESTALAYLVAFDLEQFDLGFRLGTDHPRVGWSDMVLPPVRDEALPGPDGIETVEPLVRTGMLSPLEARRVAATFTGGFKRTHGAFRLSQLATLGQGSHYGFVENGVVLSKLQPGLATALVLDDGSVRLQTWRELDDALLPRIRHARQNGVAILEREDAEGRTLPGSRVREWGRGNWSGSADRKLRTLRAGLCLQESQGKQFLVYGYFSSATPSAMARVFQAAGCSYAMLLDMNALEHTYMALYRSQGSRLLFEHLIEGMGDVDGSRDGQPLPRFVSVADNRDFFYLLRRSPR